MDGLGGRALRREDFLASLPFPRPQIGTTISFPLFPPGSDVFTLMCTTVIIVTITHLFVDIFADMDISQFVSVSLMVAK